MELHVAAPIAMLARTGPSIVLLRLQKRVQKKQLQKEACHAAGCKVPSVFVGWFSVGVCGLVIMCMIELVPTKGVDVPEDECLSPGDPDVTVGTPSHTDDR